MRLHAALQLAQVGAEAVRVGEEADEEAAQPVHQRVVPPQLLRAAGERWRGFDGPAARTSSRCACTSSSGPMLWASLSLAASSCAVAAATCSGVNDAAATVAASRSSGSLIVRLAAGA